MREPRDFNDPSYVAWRKKVYGRDHYTCRMCGNNRDLNAHHIKRWANYPELRYALCNGITLCGLCHDRVTGHEEEYEEILLSYLGRQVTKNKYDKFDIERMLNDLK